ncbi:helix-turn-helix domain-containing protein [Mesorhizobium sp. 1B3]|uniref:helix-turn-helix domain-containing protein n=1 Tax=Mesorhizobium sp. 1B3 TaxID=3243599 RepID=UPI003D97DB46
MLGANLDAVQMAGPHLRGSLAYSVAKGIIFSSGLIEGKVALSGPLSADAITLLVNLRAGLGTLFSLHQADAGDIAILHPGAHLDAHYGSGALYFAATLSARKLAEEVAHHGVVFDRSLLKTSGLHREAIPRTSLEWMTLQLMRIHREASVGNQTADEIAGPFLGAAICRLGVAPWEAKRTSRNGRVTIVERARQYILQNLSSAISMPALAAAAATSQRTMLRAFSEVLEITPDAYVRILRLNRVRRDLVSDWGEDVTVSMIARRYGIGELGRLSKSYRMLFGENPSQTLVKSRSHRPNRIL